MIFVAAWFAAGALVVGGWNLAKHHHQRKGN